MAAYFLKRLAGAVPVFLAIVTAAFFMARFVPGGPFDRERPVSAETLKALNAYYGLDEPLAAQYLKYLGNLARGDLGPSYKYPGWSVNEIIAQKAAVSLQLGAAALAIALVAGLLLGFGAAAFAGTKFGAALSGMSLAGICLPAFVLGPILALIFSIKLRWFNAMGWNELPSDAVLPAITLALFYAAWIARLRAEARSRRSRASTSSRRARRERRKRAYISRTFCATR